MELLKKFRVHILGRKFTVVIDCNALKATSKKKELLPRIARWWLQPQAYDFYVLYRPGERMKHVDALSRNALSSTMRPEEISLHISQADWVLPAQLTDEKICDIKEILSKPPLTAEEREIYRNYSLRDGRVHRITVRGIQ